MSSSWFEQVLRAYWPNKNTVEQPLHALVLQHYNLKPWPVLQIKDSEAQMPSLESVQHLNFRLDIPEFLQ